MKVTIVILAVLALTVAALTAQPLTPVMTQLASPLQAEPAWMVLSGAVLIVVASVVRRVAS